jgi:hypothetical protein
MPITVSDAVFSNVGDIAKVVPSVTTWSRLETLPYTSNLQPGLQAQIADPLWLLARQWQFNELQGEDAGTPVDVRVDGERAPLARYSLGAQAMDSAKRARDYQQKVPLEVLVEREGVRTTHPRVNAEAGLQFFDCLAAHGVGALGSQYVAKYPLALAGMHEPSVGELADPKGAGWGRLLTGRAMDARALARDLRPFTDVSYNLSDLPNQPVLSDTDKAKVKLAASRWLRWYDEAVSEPAETNGLPPAWNPQRQEYAFALSGKLKSGPVLLNAPEYTDGELDWYSFDIAATPDLGTTASPMALEPVRISPTLPTLARYSGMPADRYWEFEDGAVNLGMIDAGPTDLTQMLLAEFGLVYGNDWFVVPLKLPVGSVFRINRCAVRDTFGVESIVNRSRNGDGTSWTMFELSRESTAPAYLRDVFFLAPTLSLKHQGDPLEEVALFRDEVANMVWGVERRVQGASGEAYSRYSEATQTAARQELKDAGDANITADILYRLATSVPENWIPFVAVPAKAAQPAGEFDIQLERRAMLRTLFDGSRVSVYPRGQLLRSDPSRNASEEPTLKLEEEEVPREGIVVQRTMQAARWIDGRTYTWLGRRKKVGRGEGASGLRFDAILAKK